MSQIMVDVQLKEIDEKDVLVFILDKENPEKYIVNLNSATSQLELKEVFAALLELVMKENVALQLTIEDGYSKGLYKEVCEEYIRDLNKEIGEVKQNITKQME